MLSTSELMAKSPIIDDILRPRQQARGQQRVQRIRDLLQFVAEETCQRLARQETPRMAGEEDQEVQVAWIVQDPDAVEQTLSLFVCHDL